MVLHNWLTKSSQMPEKCGVGEIWEQKELILAWLVQSQVP